jgi:DNA-binding response OmpR family regulator
VVKPFFARELLARIQAVLRRAQGSSLPLQFAWLARAQIDFAICPFA